MSVLTNKGFDQAIAKATKPLQALLKQKRETGLASIKKLLEEKNYGNLNEAELRNFAIEVQEPILADGKDSEAVEKALSKSMLAIGKEARKESTETWEIEASTELPVSDPRKKILAENTAGAFLLLRDRSLAETIADRFVAWAASKREKILKLQDDPFSFFANPWGEKAEKRYWTLVCGAWLGKSRNYSIAMTFHDAGMIWCKIAAEIDERTTHICRFLHMKRILISSVIAETANLVAPGTTSNWIAETPPPPVGGLTADTQKPLLLLPPLQSGGKPRPMAQRTEEHMVGTAEFDMGKYSQFITDEELAKTLGPPPYHFLCRSLLVPDDFKDPLELQAEITQKPLPSGIEDFITETF